MKAALATHSPHFLPPGRACAGLLIIALTVFGKTATAEEQVGGAVDEARERMDEVVEVADATASGRDPLLTQQRRAAWTRWFFSSVADNGSEVQGLEIWLWSTSITNAPRLAQSLRHHATNDLAESRCSTSSSLPAAACAPAAQRYQPFDDDPRFQSRGTDQSHESDSRESDGRGGFQLDGDPVAVIATRRRHEPYKPFDDSWDPEAVEEEQELENIEACRVDWQVLDWTPGRCILATPYQPFQQELAESKVPPPTMTPLYHPVDGKIRDLQFSYRDSSWTLVTSAAAVTYPAQAGPSQVAVVEASSAASAFEAGKPELAVLAVFQDEESARYVAGLILKKLCHEEAKCVARLVTNHDQDIVLIIHVRWEEAPVLLPTGGWAYLLEQP